MKQRNSADGSLLICPDETALLCVAKESREALRAPEVPAPQRAALQATKGISAGGYITHPYVSGASVRSSSSSWSRALNHRWCSERSKEFEAVVPRGTRALFSSTKKKKKCCVTMKARLCLLEVSRCTSEISVKWRRSCCLF